MTKNIRALYGRHIDSAQFGQERSLYTTREELQAAEARGEGKIRWDVFDRLIAKNREPIENAIKKYNFKIYCYNIDGQLLNIFQASKEAAEVTGIEITLINTYSKLEQPYFKEKLLFLRRPIYEVLKEKPDLLKQKKDNSQKTVYVYRNSTKELIGEFEKAKDADKALELSDGTSAVYVKSGKPHFKKDLLFSHKKLNFL